jgi:hypothetical protein
MNNQQKNFSIYSPLTQGKVTYEVSVQAKYYDDFVRVYIPNHPFEKIHAGYEVRNVTKQGSYENEKISNETDRERSIRRTKTAVRDYVLRNRFDMFVTFTFRTDRYDIELIKKKMASWLKNQRKRNGAFRYLIVAEFHKDGALHFHALFGGYSGDVVRSYNTKSQKPIVQNGRAMFELPSYTLGYNSVIYIDDDSESRGKVSSYLMKYITKDMPIIFGQNRYWVSKGLKKPVVEDNPEKWYEIVEPDSVHVTEYGKFLIFKKGNPLVDMYIEAYTP